MAMVAFVGWRLVRTHSARKAKAYAEKVGRADLEYRRRSTHTPEWFLNISRRQEFFCGVKQHALRQGVPQEHVDIVLGRESSIIRLCFYAGALEKEGLSWIEQQMAVGDRVVFGWEEDNRLERQWGWITESDTDVDQEWR